jgi:hypothetical protein
MSKASSLKKIEMELKNLPLGKQRRLIAQMRKRLSEKRSGKKILRDWSQLYGLGKGLWRRQDAQAYVNKQRGERV